LAHIKYSCESIVQLWQVAVVSSTDQSIVWEGNV